LPANDPADPQDQQGAGRQARHADVKAKTDSGSRPAEPSPDGLCFVISPFGEWHDRYYQEIFVPAIAAANLDPMRADSLFRPSNIVHDIWHGVTASRVMLADLTGRNPNVFYELGLAHATRKPVLLLTQDIDDVPFDLRGLRVIQYDLRNPQWGIILREKITSGLKETLKSPEKAVLPTFLLEDPGRPVQISAGEERYLDLLQQVNALRAELRTYTGNALALPPSAGPPAPSSAGSLTIVLRPVPGAEDS